MSDDGWCGVSGRPVWYHIHGQTVYAVGCPRTDLVSLGSFPDKVGLFGRRKDAHEPHYGRT